MEVLQSLLPSLLFLPLLLLISLLLLLRHRPKPHQRQPPSPPKLPVIGNLHQLGRLPHRSLRTLASRHSAPLMLLHLGSAPVLLASTAAAAKAILKTHDHAFSSRPPSVASDRLFYSSRDVAFAPYGEYWRQTRRVCTLHLLSARRVRLARAVREEEVATVMAKVGRSAEGGRPVDVSEALIEMTNDVICRVALGRRYSGEEDVGGGRGLRAMLKEYLELLGSPLVEDYIPSLSWVDKVCGKVGRMERSAREMDKLLEMVVDDHVVRRRISGKEEADGRMSFVDVLMGIEEEGSSGVSLERDSIKGIILDMFIGGTYTTFTVIDWAMAELMQHPEAMRKAQEESREVGGGKPTIDEDDISRMRYLKAVVKEALRLHPPLPLLVHRESITNVELNGYHIPKGTRVMINAYAVARDPTMWDEPEEFLRERFLDGRKSAMMDFIGINFEFVPFGGGRRGCPGVQFGVSMVEIALANLLYGFDWEVPEGEKLDMDEECGIGVSRKHGLVLVAKPHSC